MRELRVSGSGLQVWLLSAVIGARVLLAHRELPHARRAGAD